MPSVEMTVTLQDVAMILGLSIRRWVITARVDPDGWWGMVEGYIGVHLDMEENKSLGISVVWLHGVRGICPAHIDPLMIE